MTAIGHAGHAPSATTGVGGDAPPVQRIELPVVGLTCGACVQAVEQALRAVPGVSAATVNLSQGRAFVEYDPVQTTVATLHEAIKTAGYRSEMATARFRIDGITCASCVTKIERALRDTPGVLAATVSVGSEEATVDYVPSVTDLPAVTTAVGSAGYRVIETPAPAAPSALDREAEARTREYRTLMRQWWFGASVGVFTMVLSYPWLFPVLRDWFPRESHQLWYMWALMGAASLAVILVSGRHFFTGAWQALRHRSANMHTLIALAFVPRLRRVTARPA